MKIFFCLFIVSTVVCRADGVVSWNDEVKAIDCLIEATVDRLSSEKKLRELMVQFKVQREQFLAGEQTKAHTALMVRTARQILKVVKERQLSYLFSLEYLEELVVFSSVASTPRPGRIGPQK